MEHWENAIWSNKSSFTVFLTSDRICIRRTPSHIYDPECLPLRTWRCFIHGMRTHVVVFCRTHHYPASLPVGLHRWQRQCEHFERWGPSHGPNSSLMVMLFIKMITPMLNNSHYPELFFGDQDEVSDLIGPPRSPDLQHIQPLWSVLEKNFRLHLLPPSSLKELASVLPDKWVKIP